MILIAAALGGIGFACMLFRRTMLGMLIGIQLMVLGATMFFILAGVVSGAAIQGQLFGFFIILGGVAQIIVGYALAVRVFYLKKRVAMDELRTLKQ
jgi:NADH-quinone oxidoreductase subunit K